MSETITKFETLSQKSLKQIQSVTIAIEALNYVTRSGVSNSISCKLNSIIAKNDWFEDLKSIAIF